MSGRWLFPALEANEQENLARENLVITLSGAERERMI